MYQTVLGFKNTDKGANFEKGYPYLLQYVGTVGFGSVELIPAWCFHSYAMTNTAVKAHLENRSLCKRQLLFLERKIETISNELQCCFYK